VTSRKNWISCIVNCKKITFSKNAQSVFRGSNPAFHGICIVLHQVQHFYIQFERKVQITVDISENSSESSPTDKAKLTVPSLSHSLS